MKFLLQAIPGLPEHIRRQRDRKRLLDMPDYLLEDIGLTRARVIRKTRSHFFRRIVS